MNRPKMAVDLCDIHRAATSRIEKESVIRSAIVAAKKEDGATPGVKSIEIEPAHGTLSVNAVEEVKAVPILIGRNGMNPENHHDELEEGERKIADGNVENATLERMQRNTVMSTKDVYEPRLQIVQFLLHRPHRHFHRDRKRIDGGVVDMMGAIETETALARVTGTTIEIMGLIASVDDPVVMMELEG